VKAPRMFKNPRTPATVAKPETEAHLSR
jgi:hypothetical protein